MLAARRRKLFMLRSMNGAHRSTPQDNSPGESPGDQGPDRAAGCACCACGPAAAERTGQRLRMLARLSEIAVEMAEMTCRQAKEAGWLSAEGPVMIERIGRMVRRTIALEIRLEEQAQAPKPPRAPPPPRAPQPAAEGDAETRDDTRDAEMGDAEIGDAEIGDAEMGVDARDSEDALADPREPLEDPDEDMGGAPVAAVLAAIHRDLRAGCDYFGIADDGSGYPQAGDAASPAAPGVAAMLVTERPEQRSDERRASSAGAGPRAASRADAGADRGADPAAEDDGSGPALWSPRGSSGRDPP